MFLNIPEFIWENIFVVINTVVCGIIIGYFTSTFLKRKEEKTRVAGTLLEKRITSEQNILNFLEKMLFKYELVDKKIEIINLLSKFDIPIIDTNYVCYAGVFKSMSGFEKFFHEFENIVSKNKLWLDKRVRRHLMLIQAYFSWINSIPIIVKNLIKDKKIELTSDEEKKICDKVIFIFGVALDSEVNGLIAYLEELVVNSVYQLDLRRPKKSITRNGMFNKDTIKVLKELNENTILGRSKDSFFSIIYLILDHGDVHE